MDPGTSKERFEELLAASGVALAALTPEAGLELMIRLFADDPVDRELSGSWGLATRYGDDEFGFHFSLSFPDYTSLRLCFKVGPRSVAGDFPGWMKTCGEPGELATFRSAIQESPPFRVWGQSTATGVALIYGSPETHLWPLVDAWGMRDPSRPIVSMTEEDWLESPDAAPMVRWFRQEWRGDETDLDRLLFRYSLACARKIWILLPHESSRAGIEVAERYIDGLATEDEYGRAEWLAEAAALGFDADLGSEEDAENAARWAEELARVPIDEVAALLHSPMRTDDLSALGLLRHAAHFANIAICYPSLEPREGLEEYRLFLSAPLLREMVGNPFR